MLDWKLIVFDSVKWFYNKSMIFFIRVFVSFARAINAYEHNILYSEEVGNLREKAPAICDRCTDSTSFNPNYNFAVLCNVVNAKKISLKNKSRLLPYKTEKKIKVK